jgi:hypothetical protein
VILYVSKTSDTLNTKKLKTESLSDYICLNPKYGSVSLSNKNVKILMDSGAFQDTDGNKRISIEDALERQLKFEKRIGVVSQRIVSYDFINNVKETIKANKYLVSKRDFLKPRQLVLMVQGNTIEEYISCLKKTLRMSEPNDCIGFGGVAMAGRIGDVKEKLLDVFKYCIPLLYKKGIRDIHIFGVGTFDVLREIKRIEKLYCDLLNIPDGHFNISCDTAAFEIRSTMGNVINPETERWEKVYSKSDKYVNYHPCDITQLNIKRGINIIGAI